MERQALHCLVAAAMLGGIGHAQAQSPISVYSNDFETLNPGSPNCTPKGIGEGGNQVGGTFSTDFSTTENPISQILTADRICTKTAAPDSVYSDPDNPANKYAGGLLTNTIEGTLFSHLESISMVFDPQEKPTLNLSMQWSISNLDDGFIFDYWPTQPTTAYVHARYFIIPSGATFRLENDPGKPARVFINDSQASPFVTTDTPITRTSFAPADKFVLDWRTQNDSLDLAANGFTPTDTVGVVIHVSNENPAAPIYMAFDNLEVTATDEPATPGAPNITLGMAATSITTEQGAAFSGQVTNPGNATEVMLVIRNNNNDIVASTSAQIASDGRYSEQIAPLPAGSYQVTASLGSLTRTANFTVTAVNVPNPGAPENAAPVPSLSGHALALLGALMAAAAFMRRKQVKIRMH